MVLHDGTVHRAGTGRPLGAPDRPLPTEVREAKLAETTGDPARARRIRALLAPLMTAAPAPALAPATATTIAPAAAQSLRTTLTTAHELAVDSAPTTIGELARELAAPPTPTEGPTR